MKKTITINISGIIFHIDEDAYDRLNRYMNRLKRHFAKMEGHDEIITDIESRIAELLQEKILENKQVITIEDIEDVIRMMGEPAEMDQDSDYEPASEPGRPYRRPQRLFRDPDNRMVAGVASGLSAYFNIDPVWIRVLFIVSLFLSGAGLIAYIVLWIVVPQALTTAEKLEMRGEPVNISNIERSFRDEFNNVKDKFNEFADGAKESFKKKSPVSRTIFDNLIDFTGSALRIILKIAIVIIGLILIVSGLGFIVAITVGSAGLSSFSFFDNGELISFSMGTFLDSFFPGTITGVLAVTSFILFTGIPLIMLVYLGIRLIAGTRARVPYIGITAFSFWLAGLVMGIAVAIITATDFRHSARISQDYEVPLDTTTVLYVKSIPDPAFNSYSSRNSVELFDGEWNMVMREDKYDIFAVPDFSASLKTFGDGITVEVSSYAKGSSRSEADERAAALIYPVQVSDSVLILPTFYHFPPHAKIRAQYVRVKLRLPVGQMVHFDDNMETFFDDNPNYHYRRDNLEGNTWIMTKSGLEPYVEGEADSYAPGNEKDMPDPESILHQTFGLIHLNLSGI
jgi:phage shock protein PspC (stress-responsive transcriptional regulator)